MTARATIQTPECAHQMPLDSRCTQCERINQSEINPSTRSNTMNAAQQIDTTAAPAAITIASPISALPRIGEYWPGQGGVRIGTVRGQNGQPDYELIRPTDPATDLDDREWGIYGKKIEGADHMTDGLANTLALAAAGNENAIAIQGMTVEGHQDLYWASKGEMALIHLNTPDLLKKGEVYWSSTQYSSSYAWYQSFDDGLSSIDTKVGTLRVCAVRRFVIPSTI